MIIQTIGDSPIQYKINRVTLVAGRGNAYVPEVDQNIVFVKKDDYVVFQQEGMSDKIMLCTLRENFRNICGLFLVEKTMLEYTADLFKGKVVDK